MKCVQLRRRNRAGAKHPDRMHEIKGVTRVYVYYESVEVYRIVGIDERGGGVGQESAARRLVDAFLAGRTEQTLRTYQQSLEEFAAFMKLRASLRLSICC
jgi:hypothetical protein